MAQLPMESGTVDTSGRSDPGTQLSHMEWDGQKWVYSPDSGQGAPLGLPKFFPSPVTGAPAPVVVAQAAVPATTLPAASFAVPAMKAAAIPAAAATAHGVAVSGASGPPITFGGNSALDYAFKYILPTAGQVLGLGLNYAAGSDAAKEQTKFTQQALDDARAQRDIENKRYEDQTAYDRAQKAGSLARFADYSAKLDPYITRGNAAGTRLESLLANSRYHPEVGGSFNPPQGAAVVRMMAPDGSVRDLSEQDAVRAEQLGARRV